MHSNPIVFVEDDHDDQELISAAVNRIGIQNEIELFADSTELIRYLTNAQEPPFLIICNVNLAPSGAFTLRKKLMSDPDLRYKSVPFIFWSTHASDSQVKEAYDMLAQGFFHKPSSFTELCNQLELIIKYWTDSLHPKSSLKK